MTNIERTVRLAVVMALATPGVLLAVLSLGTVIKRQLRERTVARLTSVAMLVCVVSLILALAIHLTTDLEPAVWTAREWFGSGGGALRFDLFVDAWSLSFALLAAIICGVVGAFSYRYLHRERGFNRYFILYSCFVMGILFVALAGSVEVLFAGWELLGLSSALLVAFFHERRAPVVNAMQVFATYRVSDAAMLISAVLIHHATGSGSLAPVFAPDGAGPIAQLSTVQITTISVFLIAAVAGKSALFPFSGWLPRAMEGPTPSSAVYYGALSVHAGCYLLWRAEPLLERSIAAQLLAGAAGITTALYATVMARVQSDVKSALSYATLTQVGLIILEIALGFRTLAFIHMTGNVCLRLVQFLSAPNALQDLSALETRTSTNPSARALDPRFPSRIYVLSLERGGIDAMVDRWVVAPFLWATRLLDGIDRWLSGENQKRARHTKARRFK